MNELLNAATLSGPVLLAVVIAFQWVMNHRITLLQRRIEKQNDAIILLCDGKRREALKILAD